MSPRLGQWSGPDPPARPQRAALAASETDTTAPTGTGLSASGSQLVSGNKIGRYGVSVVKWMCMSRNPQNPTPWRWTIQSLGGLNSRAGGKMGQNHPQQLRVEGIDS